MISVLCLNEFENQTCTLLSLQQKIESESKGLNLRREAREISWSDINSKEASRILFRAVAVLLAVFAHCIHQENKIILLIS